MSLNNSFRLGALTLVLALGACGDDSSPNTECGAGTMLVNGRCESNAECGNGTTLVGGECVSDSTCGTGTVLTNGMCLPMVTPPVTTYRQVEFLGRPGIGEALILSNPLLDAYNQFAPFFPGVPQASVDAVIGEVKTVLRALFYGTCLLNGVAGFADPAMAARPGGVSCANLGLAIFTENTAVGVTLTAATIAAATVYADRVTGQFVTDTLRIDTVPNASTYLTPCSATLATGVPLLCGGRHIKDDVIDTTYFYLVAGAAVPTGATLPGPVQTQVIALVTDGVYFSSVAGENVGTLGTADASNRNQFKPLPSAAFPYSAAPL